MKYGDIIFKSKSTSHTASIYEDDHAQTVCTSHFFNIRIRNPEINPLYLQWYINSDKAQRYFSQYAGGTSISIVNKKVLENLSIHIPPMDTQQRIIDIIRLHEQEKELTKQLIEKKEKLINTCINKLISEVH